MPTSHIRYPGVPKHAVFPPSATDGDVDTSYVPWGLATVIPNQRHASDGGHCPVAHAHAHTASVAHALQPPSLPGVGHGGVDDIANVSIGSLGSVGGIEFDDFMRMDVTATAEKDFAAEFGAGGFELMNDFDTSLEKVLNYSHVPPFPVGQVRPHPLAAGLPRLVGGRSDSQRTTADLDLSIAAGADPSGWRAARVPSTSSSSTFSSMDNGWNTGYTAFPLRSQRDIF